MANQGYPGGGPGDPGQYGGGYGGPPMGPPPGGQGGPGPYGGGYGGGPGGPGGPGQYGGGYGAPGGQKPRNLLPWTIVSLLCCGGIFAIPAIVFAAQTNSRWDSGNYAGSLDAARKAKTWLIVAVCVGVVVDIIVLISRSQSM